MSFSSYSSTSPIQPNKSEQVTQNFYTKFAQIILQSRIDVSPGKLNKWFNLELDDSDDLRNELKFWKAQAASSAQPLVINVYLDVSQMDTDKQVLTLNGITVDLDALRTVDGEGNLSAKTAILLETWQLNAL